MKPTHVRRASGTCHWLTPTLNPRVSEQKMNGRGELNALPGADQAAYLCVCLLDFDSSCHTAGGYSPAPPLPPFAGRAFLSGLGGLSPPPEALGAAAAGGGALAAAPPPAPEPPPFLARGQ